MNTCIQRTVPPLASSPPHPSPHLRCGLPRSFGRSLNKESLHHFIRQQQEKKKDQQPSWNLFMMRLGFFFTAFHLELCFSSCAVPNRAPFFLVHVYNLGVSWSLRAIFLILRKNSFEFWNHLSQNVKRDCAKKNPQKNDNFKKQKRKQKTCTMMKPKASVLHPLNGGVRLGGFINRYYAKLTACEWVGGCFFRIMKTRQFAQLEPRLLTRNELINWNSQTRRLFLKHSSRQKINYNWGFKKKGCAKKLNYD